MPHVMPPTGAPTPWHDDQQTYTKQPANQPFRGGLHVEKFVRIRSGDRHAHAASGHEQAMRVDTVRRAGHQGHAVLTLDDAQSRGIVRIDDGDAVHLVRLGDAHDLDIKEIPCSSR